MAQKQAHRTKENDRVRIKDTVTHMYPMARVYMEGTVTDRMHDNFGYPLILIQWDKDHWAYSGEEDRWVMEAHFELVEEKMADDELIGDLIKFLESRKSKDGPKDEKASRLPADAGSYDGVLERAFDAAANAEAFIVLVAKKDTLGDADVIIPDIYMNHKREDAALLLEGTMSDAGAQTHARLVYEATRRLNGDNGPASP